jgi:hypothetical protein
LSRYLTVALGTCAAVSVLCGCGSDAPRPASTPSGRPVRTTRSHIQTSTSRVQVGNSTTSVISKRDDTDVPTEIPDVCELLTSQQIDGQLGGTYTPISYGGLPSGYFSQSFLKTYRAGDYFHTLDPSITLIADATCNWSDKGSSLPGGGYPTFMYSLITLSSPPPQHVFLQEYDPAHQFSSNFAPVSDLGDWAYYQPGELNVSRGRMLLTVSKRLNMLRWRGSLSVS